RALPDPRRPKRLMDALARLLSRRGDTGSGATASLPSRGRTRRDLLHASGLSTEQLRLTWIEVSTLLTYRYDDTIARWSTVRRLVAALPDPARGAMLRTIDLLDGRDAVSVQEEYVDTFDTRRRGCLHLTYFSHGDTRRRGMALLRI